MLGKGKVLEKGIRNTKGFGQWPFKNTEILKRKVVSLCLFMREM